MSLNEKQLKFLRGKAHPLKPVIMIGKTGLSAGVAAETERALIDSIGAFAEGRTLVMAAHRSASLAIVDRVLTLEGGRLVADETAAAEVL